MMWLAESLVETSEILLSQVASAGPVRSRLAYAVSEHERVSSQQSIALRLRRRSLAVSPMASANFGRCRPTALPSPRSWRTRRSISTVPALDAAIKRATADPYHLLPRAVVMAATSTAPCIYSGRGGYAQLPSRPTPADELACRGELITDTSIFELYSCTKLVAAVATLQLVEQGRLGLDDDASHYVPELGEVKLFKGFDAEGELVLEENRVPITVRMLLTHTAGTVNLASEPLRGFPQCSRGTLQGSRTIRTIHP
jgi:CubicO group peptidase (beta-lactamase class C family)